MIETFLHQAGLIAMPNFDLDKRGFWVGAIAIRKDGARVQSPNGSVISTSHCSSFPAAHAEARVLKKAGKGAILFVARVSKKNKMLSISRPCLSCLPLLRLYQVEKCYYTISPTQYGIIDVINDSERVKTTSVFEDLVFKF